MAHPPSNTESLLRWDCVYQAAGLMCYSLPHYLDFNTVLGPPVVANLKDCGAHRILRRRAAWVIGQWAAVIPSPRLHFYELLLATAQEGGDIVIRLTAIKALFWLVDDLQFEPNSFSSLLPALMEQIFFFLQHSRCIDVRLSLVSFVILLMEKMDTVLAQYTATILSIFMKLWTALQASSEADSTETRLKSYLVIALTSLVKCLGEQSQNVHELVLPMIMYTTNINSEDGPFLLEAGLELWQATLQYTVSLSPQLLDCFSSIPSIVTNDTETLAQALSIVDSYIFVGRGMFLERYVHELNNMLGTLLSEAKDVAQVLCTNVLDTLLHVFPDKAPAAVQAVLVKVMQYLLNGREGDLVIANYLCVLLRILLTNRPWFIGFVGDHFSMFLDKWIDLHDCLPTNYQRKLSCLALLSLLPVPPEDVVVLPRLAPILHTAVEGVAAESGDWTVDFGPHSNEEVPLGCPEAARRQELSEKDVVLNLSVKQLMQEKLQELYTTTGPQVMQVILTDPVLMSTLNTYFATQ
uniref:Importin-7/11-like TPR repeats domain-containing protein n=1 Tax=Eutreptiella gymnastica TaxID=73025 RepID=A0A7S1IJM2_9EUGL